MNVLKNVIHDLLTSKYKNDIYIAAIPEHSSTVSITLMACKENGSNSEIFESITISSSEFLAMLLSESDALSRIINKLEAQLVKKIIEIN